MNGIPLRPHHALCVQSFEGKGYSEDFVDNMTRMIGELNGKNPTVTLTKDCDRICFACPNNINGVCNTDDTVKEIDKRALLAMGLSFGDTIAWNKLNSLAQHAVLSGELREICRGCMWLYICDKDK